MGVPFTYGSHPKNPAEVVLKEGCSVVGEPFTYGSMKEKVSKKKVVSPREVFHQRLHCNILHFNCCYSQASKAWSKGSGGRGSRLGVGVFVCISETAVRGTPR